PDYTLSPYTTLFRSDVIAPQRRRAFSSLARSDMSPQPEVVVPLESQREEFVKERLAKSLSGLDPRAGLIVIALRLRKPMDAQRADRKSTRLNSSHVS